MNIESFPAHKGDAFVLKWREGAADRYILVDSGTPATYMHIKPYLQYNGLPIAIVVTHVDYDHVGGFIKMFNDESIDAKGSITVYVNTPELILGPMPGDEVSVVHGLTFARSLEQVGLQSNPLYLGVNLSNEILFPGISFYILSPPKEVIERLMEEWAAQPLHQKLMAEKTPPDEVSASDQRKLSYEEILAANENIPRWQDDLDNSASIAFMAADSYHQVLMLGDSNPTLVCEALQVKGYTATNKLRVNLVKLSHHGCRNNTSKNLLALLDCKCFYISTNGTGNYYHPHRESIVRICEYCRSDKHEHLRFFTNYELDTNRFITAAEMRDWNISFTYKPELDIEECQ
jgi:beta-lactamase superfamily II metal-dependent hydrolase